MLYQHRRDRVLYLHVPEPVSPGDGLDNLAWALLDVCDEIQSSDDPPLAVALTAEGLAFCVRPPERADDLDALGDAWTHAVVSLEGLGPPTVAAIGGAAIGPALDLALACDLRVLADGVIAGCPEASFGRLPVPGGVRRLTRAVGGPTATRLLLLGEMVGAEEAVRIGLAQYTARSADLQSRLEQVLATLRAASPIALTLVKEAAGRAPSLAMDDGLRLEADLAALLMTTADRAEGIASFLERRTPHFEGR